MKPTPFQILLDMREASGKFDRKILVEFIQLLGTGLTTNKVGS